ncbi:histidinol-phosphate transaminase [Paraburkholderia sediminicola]|uniref:histidinol-phosphate transaminase n=1 Tax=Paraburkholderia sediminicola TaxID=458836 RepID=UPI000EB2C0D8
MKVVSQSLKSAPHQIESASGGSARKINNDEASVIKLDFDENPLGMSPTAREMAHAAIAESTRYPDANGLDLKTSISAKYRVPLDWLTLGAGSSDILELVATAFLGPGKSAVFSRFSYHAYAQAALRSGAEAIPVPTRDFGNDLNAMLEAVRENTSVVFIANPNNPTGTYLQSEELTTFVEKLPKHVLLVLDEAYNEYLRDDLRHDSIPLVRNHPNVLVTRTFSKAYGLAGLRIGYSISTQFVTEYLNRIRLPFNVSNVAQAAAIGALRDEKFLQCTFDANERGMSQLSTGLRKLAIPFVVSHANFILARFGEATNRVNRLLLGHNIVVRSVADYGLEDWLRISIGVEEQTEKLLETLRQPKWR